ncbi:DUF7857 domain-containing protein [Halobellus rufus]|uniref:DUF7857 domain-containing protein n=1 Tax=Halobellus rufus TaxID=1448860 RepID=UPI00067918AE|nr:hypothetical protein [Halobellus rufus]
MRSSLDVGSGGLGLADENGLTDEPDLPIEADLTDGTRPPGSDPIESTVSTRSLAGVTLVRIELRSTVAADLRVRVRNELDGPLLPPREEGVPASGWDADGFRGVVPASGRLGIGYACPVAPPDVSSDAASIEVLGPVIETERRSVASTGTGSADSDSDTVTTAIRSLGRARPPADAVGSEGSSDSASGASNAREGTAGAAVPTAVETWLDAVESRIDHAERLTDATAADATAVLADCGGADALVGLPATVDADEVTLRAVADRVIALADRAAATDPEPVVSSLSAAAESQSGEPADPTRGGER